MKIELHYQFLETKILVTSHNYNILNSNLNLALGWSPHGKYKNFTLIFWSNFWLKHIIKLILIKSIHLNLLISSFRIKIESWKYEKNIKTKNLKMELKLFQKKKMILFHTPTKLKILLRVILSFILFLLPRCNHLKTIVLWSIQIQTVTKTMWSS
jgi:hypothetical protein